MKNITTFILIIINLWACTGENTNKRAAKFGDASEASTSDNSTELAPDVLVATKPLIGGQLYRGPSFESPTLANFDTSQLIQVLDTTHNIFVRARIRRDTVTMTGYVARTILPEKTTPAQ